MDSLKAARGLFRDYMQKFGKQTRTTRLGRGGDQAGNFIKKIVLEDPTDEQVINSLWTASSFNKQSGATLANRYKGILGADSNEWNMVRQAAFDDLIVTKQMDGQVVVDGARTFTNIQKAEKANKSLINELFTSEEWAKVKRFSVLAKRTAPDLVRSRENPSGTTQKLLKEAMRVLPFIEPGSAIGAGGAIFLKDFRNARAARHVFRPIIEASAGRQVAQATATAASPSVAESLPGM